MPLFHAVSVSLAVFFCGLCMVACIECPNGWTTYNRSCYWFTRNHPLSFVEVEHYCQQHGGHLVIVESEEENLFIRDFLRGMKNKRHREKVHQLMKTSKGYILNVGVLTDECLRNNMIIKAESHWLDLSDEKVGGIWEWYSTNTRPTYTNWYPGETNDFAGNEDCSIFYSVWDYNWADISCDTKQEPICEIESEGSIVVG